MPTFPLHVAQRLSGTVFNKLKRALNTGSKLKYSYVCASKFKKNGQKNSYESESGYSVFE